MAKSIEFPGTAGNRYDYAINNNQDLTTAYTILAVVRILAADDSWQSIIESQTAAAGLRPSMGRQGPTTDRLYLSDSSSLTSANGIELHSTDSWQMIADTHTAGTTIPRGHRVIFGGATTHEDMAGGTLGDQTAYPTGKFLVAGDDDPANIRVAAWAIWDGTAISDANFNTIRDAMTTQSILDLSPTACYDSENGLLLTDLTAGGMNGSLVGAITESSDGPTGWAYFGSSAGNQIAWVRA